MLLEKLGNLTENRNVITDAFMKSRDLKVKRITYMSNTGYGSGINVYITMKNGGFSPLEAFLGLWLRNTLWEEEIEDFDYSEEHCEMVFQELFLDTASGYDLKSVSPDEANRIMAGSINAAMRDIMNQIVETDNIEDIGFMDEPGIYVNGKYTEKTPVIMKKKDFITDAVRLFSSDIMGDFEELFIETNERYIYFFK